MATNYYPEATIQHQLGLADRFRNQPIIPHWAGILAQGLGAVGGNLLTGSAYGAMDQNRTTMADVLRRAGEAPDNTAASRILMDSGIPGMGEKGLGFLMDSRSKAADREAKARMQRENFEFQKRLAMDLENQKRTQMMEAVNSILGGGAPTEAAQPPAVPGEPAPDPAVEGAPAVTPAPAMAAPAASPASQRITNQQAARLIMAGVPKEVVDLLRQNDGTVKVVGNKVLRIRNDGSTEVLFDSAAKRANPELQRNISAGLERLAAIPEEFDGDSPTGGTFSSAVGAFQGDDKSWVMGPLSRAWGSVASFALREKGSPTEVRARIAGDTEALAAAIKPLIRAPGEGPWTDADQARLVAVVGDLATSANADEYRRRLEGVRQRVRANFGIELSPIPGVTPKAENVEGEIEDTKVVDGKTYVKIKGDWYGE